MTYPDFRLTPDDVRAGALIAAVERRIDKAKKDDDAASADHTKYLIATAAVLLLALIGTAFLAGGADADGSDLLIGFASVGLAAAAVVIGMRTIAPKATDAGYTPAEAAACHRYLFLTEADATGTYELTELGQFARDEYLHIKAGDFPQPQ